MKAILKRFPVDVETVETPEQIKEGAKAIAGFKAGDFFITHENGTRKAITKELFDQIYEVTKL